MKRYLRDVGREIKKQRLVQSMTLPGLAEKAGISKGNLSKIENGACNIGLETLWKLAAALDINPSEFLP